jgi:hypothetical protein
MIIMPRAIVSEVLRLIPEQKIIPQLNQITIENNCKNLTKNTVQITEQLLEAPLSSARNEPAI